LSLGVPETVKEKKKKKAQEISHKGLSYPDILNTKFCIGSIFLLHLFKKVFMGNSYCVQTVGAGDIEISKMVRFLPEKWFLVPQTCCVSSLWGLEGLWALF
jgi:hypothetical protein